MEFQRRARRSTFYGKLIMELGKGASAAGGGMVEAGRVLVNESSDGDGGTQRGKM